MDAMRQHLLSATSNRAMQARQLRKYNYRIISAPPPPPLHLTFELRLFHSGRMLNNSFPVYACAHLFAVHGCFIVWHFRALSCTRKFFPTRSNEGCTFLATTLYTLHWYAVNIVINTWLATAQQDRAAIADSSGPRLTLLRHSYTELWLRAHTNLFVMGLFDSLCWLL